MSACKMARLNQQARVPSMSDKIYPSPMSCISARSFLHEEDGNGTVDFVVLTAAIVGISVAVTASLGGGVVKLADSTSAKFGGSTAAASNTETAEPAAEDETKKTKKKKKKKGKGKGKGKNK